MEEISSVFKEAVKTFIQMESFATFILGFGLSIALLFSMIHLYKWISEGRKSY